MPKSIPVTVRGYRYNSIHEAWEALAAGQIPEITVRRRLAMGWHPEDAFSVRPVPPRARRGFKQLRVGIVTKQ
jgi:hypothetical protein